MPPVDHALLGKARFEPVLDLRLQAVLASEIL